MQLVHRFYAINSKGCFLKPYTFFNNSIFILRDFYESIETIVLEII